MSLTKLGLPGWFKCDYPSQLDNAPVISDTGKVVANHLIDAGISDAQKFARGVTHLQRVYDNSLDPGKKCFILLPYSFGSSTPSDGQIQAYANSLGSIITANAAMGDQFVEAGSGAIPVNIYFEVATKFYQNLCQATGVAGAAQNNFYGSYVTDDVNFSVDFFKILGTSDRNPLHSRFLAALSSQAGARKRARNINISDGGSPQSDDGFYSSGMHEFCNSFTMMLYANDNNPLDWLFYNVFECQRKYAAKADAKTLFYSSPWAQSVNSPINTHGRNPGWIHQRTGGFWEVPNWHIVPMQYMLQLGFLGCLLAEGVYIWEVGVNYSKNIADDQTDPYVPARTWVSTGGSAPALQPYNGNNPYYPTYPETGVDAAMVGVHWYGQVKDIVTSSTGVAYAAYTSNGNPVAVQPGDPRLFRRGFQNWNQNTILHLANAQKGLCLACTGNGKTLLVYVNPYRLPTEKEIIVVSFNGQSYSLGQLEGGILHVFVYE